MRISDWSSDVCSSDLPAASGARAAPLSSKKEAASRERLQIGPNAKAGQSGTYMAGRRVRSGGAYHHGDLRAAVIAAGPKRLAKRTGLTIGLRAPPRDVGVTPPPLFPHFPHTETTLAALDR